MKNYIVIVIISVSLFACKSGADSKQIQKINALEQRLDSSHAEFKEIDSAKVFSMTEHFFENKEYISKSYTDTIDNDLARFIDSYLSMKKATNLINSSYGKTIEQISGTQERLDNLEHDLNEGLIEEKKFQQYYQLESNNVAIIEESVNNVMYAIETIQPIYDSLNPRIDSLIQESQRKAELTTE
jgi:hypothetical protein